MNKKLTLTVAAALALAGCASGVTRTPSAAVPLQQASAPAYTQFASVTLSMTPDAKAKALDNLKFNPDQLLDHVRRALEAKSLIVANDAALPKVEIVVTSMRVRSNFSAVMWGFMAGADSIEGDIVPTNTGGKELDRFAVSASYALGGLAGGQDDARMGWLYEKFAQETVNELAKQQPAMVSQR